MNYVILLGVFQSLIALLLLPASRQQRPANELLRLLLACIFVHLSIKFFIFTAVHNPGIRREFNTFTGLAYGPICWMYARKLLNDRYQPFKHWYYFIPAIASSLVYLFISVYTAWRHTEPIQLMFWYNKVILYASIANNVYFILTWRAATKLAPFWNIEKKLLLKISAILLFLGGVAIFGSFLPLFPRLNTDETRITIRIIAYASLLLVSVLIIHYELGLQRILGQHILAEATAAVEAIVIPTEGQPTINPTLHASENMTVSNTSFPDDQQRIIQLRRLNLLMVEQKLYSDPKLSLEKLASLLKIPRNQVSELINHSIGKTFYQYINEYRVKEVVALLEKCSKHHITPNILSLAFEAGFHSKSSFNIYFKKVTGYTPSEYLKKVKPPEDNADIFPVLSANGHARQYS